MPDPTPARTWQDRYGPLLAAVVFSAISAVLGYFGINAPPPQPPVTVMVAPGLTAAAIPGDR